MGSRSERLSIGGTNDATVNINQLDPSYMALGAALQQLVPNPFFGNAAFGNLSRSATIARGQLLRPYPQFDNVLAHRVNVASARYNAFVVKWDKRLQRGWGMNANYTFSRLMDNQFGEANFYANRVGLAVNNYDLDNERRLLVERRAASAERQRDDSNCRSVAANAGFVRRWRS